MSPPGNRMARHLFAPRRKRRHKRRRFAQFQRDKNYAKIDGGSGMHLGLICFHRHDWPPERFLATSICHGAGRYPLLMGSQGEAFTHTLISTARHAAICATLFPFVPQHRLTDLLPQPCAAKIAVRLKRPNRWKRKLQWHRAHLKSQQRSVTKCNAP